MGLKLSNKKAFEDFLTNIKEDHFPTYIIDELTKLGNEFIKARLNQTNTFENRTTRLRNSIGYVVSRNGKVVQSDFESFAVSGEASEEGKMLGRSYATELAQQTQGYALICVAGAPYAFYVEAKGYDVITGSVLTLEQNLRKWSI